MNFGIAVEGFCRAVFPTARDRMNDETKKQVNPQHSKSCSGDCCLVRDAPDGGDARSSAE